MGDVVTEKIQNSEPSVSGTSDARIGALSEELKSRMDAKQQGGDVAAALVGIYLESIAEPLFFAVNRHEAVKNYLSYMYKRSDGQNFYVVLLKKDREFCSDMLSGKPQKKIRPPSVKTLVSRLLKADPKAEISGEKIARMLLSTFNEISYLFEMAIFDNPIAKNYVAYGFRNKETPSLDFEVVVIREGVHYPPRNLKEKLENMGVDVGE